MSPHHQLLSGFKECQAYQSSHSYQLPNHPCLSASTSLFLYLASSNQRLIKVSTVTSYQLHHFLPHLYVFSSPCLPIIYYSLTSRDERLTKVPTVTSYLSSLAYLAAMYPQHLLLSGFKECQAYHSCHNHLS